ncbi:MAG: wax ester/triacylglycerol synthase family O-acyltransferase [Chloroflexi bacterium]|nr:wax ester/triacylglycerol synthase family O-acyltransferase [Chloroflexota bacterium]
MPQTVEPLTNVDAAWLGMEDPTNLMMVSGIMTFDRPLNIDHLKAVITHRFLKFERFRQRVIQPKMRVAPPYWETDPNFNLDAHIHRIALPEPGDQETLQTLASDLMSTPLDFSKPLWQMHIIDNYGDGGAIMTRLHHSIADGIALMSVLMALTDFSADAPWPEAKAEPQAEAEDGGAPFGGALGALFKQASSTVRTARKLTSKVVHEGLEAMIAPAKLVDLAIQGTDNALAFSRLVLRSPDSKTIFKGELGVAKRATWSRPIPLKEIKAIKNSVGGTVNDVMVAALTGSLRRYMLDRGESVDGLTFRAFVPVDIRGPDERMTLGNKFSLVFLPLPIEIADPVERLEAVRQRMDALKKSPEIPVAFTILKGIGMSPEELHDVLVKMFGAKATAVLTNVPGPPIPLYFAGGKIKDIMFWVPQSGRVSLGLSIISYAGKVQLGVASDVGLVPDPEAIVNGFYREHEAYLELARQAEAIEKKEEAEKKAKTKAEAETRTAVQFENDPDRCQGMTKSGRRCRNRAQSGGQFCHIHQT